MLRCSNDDFEEVDFSCGNPCHNIGCEYNYTECGNLYTPAFSLERG